MDIDEQYDRVEWYKDGKAKGDHATKQWPVLPSTLDIETLVILAQRYKPDKVSDPREEPALIVFPDRMSL